MDSPSDAERHRYYEELAVSHVLGGLSESDGRVFRSHLLDCQQCRARVGELRRIANDLADVERDERRVRAAKAIETKRREDEDEDEADEPLPPTRGSRIMLLVGLVALIGLLSWNILLRQNQAEQNERLDKATIVSDLLVEDNRALHTDPTGQFTAPPNRVVFNDAHVVVVLDGVEKGDLYAVYLVNNEDEILDVHAQQAVADRMTLLVDRVPGLTDLVVTQPERPPGQRDSLEGTTVLNASLREVSSPSTGS
jgi:hypothetical protein